MQNGKIDQIDDCKNTFGFPELFWRGSSLITKWAMMSSPGWWWWWEWSAPAATHTTHILEPRYHLPANRMPLSQLMHGWMDSWMDGWISFTPFTFLLHSRCTAVFLLPAVLRCQKSLSPCLESEGGSVLAFRAVWVRGGKLWISEYVEESGRVIFSAILLPHLPAPCAAELDTNLREIWSFTITNKARLA